MKIRDWDINLKIRLLGEAFLSIFFWMVFPFLTVYFSESFGRGLTSILLMVSQVIAVFCGLFGGYFADHFGRRKMMLIAVAGEVIGYGLFAVASLPIFHSPVLGFIGFSLASLFSNFYYPAGQAMIADVVEEKYRSYVFSVFYMMTNIAVVIGPLIGSFFFEKYRFELLSIVTFACMILFVLLFRYAHETAPESQTSTASQSISWKQVAKSQVKDYSIILTDKVFFLFIIAGILLSQTFMQLDLFIPLKINDTIETATLLSIGQFQWTVTNSNLFSLVLAINGGMVATLTVIATKIMMNYKESTAFISSAMIYGVSILLFGVFRNPWIYIFSIVLFTVAELLTVGIQQNFVSMLAPEDKRAMYFSAAQLRMNLGRVIAPISITLGAWLGYSATAVILAIFCFLAAWIYGKMYKIFSEKQKDMKETYLKIP